MALTVIENTPLSFDITPYLNSRGWSVDNTDTTATHTEGISGNIEFLQYNLVKNVKYDFSLNVSDLTTGDLKVIVNNVEVLIITTNGYHQGTVTPTADSHFILRSSGTLKVSDFQVKMSNDNSLSLENSTITWSEEKKGWITFKDYIPEMGLSMYTKLFTLKNGRLWAHDDLVNFNNFYGTQYETRITFPINVARISTFNSIAVHSNKVVGTTEDGIVTQLGNVSDLITFDFESREGIHYANFLNDKIMDDNLKGRYIVITLTDEDSASTKLQIFKVIVKSTQSTINE